MRVKTFPFIYYNIESYSGSSISSLAKKVPLEKLGDLEKLINNSLENPPVGNMMSYSFLFLSSTGFLVSNLPMESKIPLVSIFTTPLLYSIIYDLIDPLLARSYLRKRKERNRN